MTNADCIRHMSDEQLYEFLSEWECGDIDYSVTFCDLCNEATKRGEIGNVLNLDCDGCRKHWLQRDAVDYGGLMYWKKNTTFDTVADRKTEPTISKMEQVDKPQTDCNGCKFVGTYDTEFPCANCSRKTKDYYAKDEPQTVRSNLEPFRVDEPQTEIHGLTDCDFCKGKNCEDCEGGKDEPQTEMPRCSVNGTPYDECGFCEYFNCDTCKCEADEPKERSE